MWWGGVCRAYAYAGAELTRCHKDPGQRTCSTPHRLCTNESTQILQISNTKVRRREFIPKKQKTPPHSPHNPSLPRLPPPVRVHLPTVQAALSGPPVHPLHAEADRDRGLPQGHVLLHVHQHTGVVGPGWMPHHRLHNLQDQGMKQSTTPCLTYLGQVESNLKALQLSLLHHHSC